MQLKWRLSHAQGFLALGMVAEAAEELAAVPPAQCDRLDVIVLRAAILQEQQKWPELLDCGADWVRRQPIEPAAWITWAYAARRAQSLDAAEAILLRAERLHPRAAVVQFNLGCYACLRGDLRLARRRVERASTLDPSFKELAKTDPDLAALREPASGASGAVG